MASCGAPMRALKSLLGSTPTGLCIRRFAAGRSEVHRISVLQGAGSGQSCEHFRAEEGSHADVQQGRLHGDASSDQRLV